MKRRRVIGIAALVAVVLIGAAFVGLAVGRERAVTQAADGTLCASCHAAPPSSHPRSQCVACHADAHAAAPDLWVSSLGLTSAPAHGVVEDSACTACHDDSPGEALASEGHRAHGGECASCHTRTHSEEPVVARCESCHEDIERHGVTADAPCTSCHVFGATGADAPLARPADLGLISAASLHGAMDCRQCHDPHRDRAEPECESCHRGHLAEQVAAAPDAHQRCIDCHRPHAPREQPAVDCLSCHTYPEDRHGWSAAPDVSEEAQLATRTRITHDGQCGTCHTPHTWTANEARCTECHEEETASIAALPAGAHAGCTSCHEAHEPRPTGAVCASCHEGVHLDDGLPAAHQSCLSCHDAHGARPVARDACASCHREAHGESRGLSQQHLDCRSCHEPHGPPLAGAASACAGCHAEPTAQLTNVANVPSAHRCQSCHEPHAFEAGPAACASCHPNAIDDHASHRGTCTACHEQHGAPMGSASSCTSCHREVHPAIDAHADCTSCHEPHRLANAALAECVDCHQAELAARWPDAGPHAGQCTACHTPHAEASRTDCARCHLPQASRSHTGAHTRCTDCHAPHREHPESWWSRCTDCHANEASAVARASGTHGDCASCHRTPGPPLPRCTSCHAEAPSLLAHQTHAGIACASCHAEHGPPADIGRTACLSCHEDRTAHFPDAPRCQSCHPFGR